MNILITGASSGIGAQLARDYAAEGHRLVLCGRNRDKLEALADELTTELTLRCFDQTDRTATLAALTTLPQDLDLAILNAGDCEYIDATRFDSELFERVMRVNVLGVAYCIEALTGHIKPGGRLALTGSSAAFLPLPRAEAYGASKAALRYLAQTLMLDLKRTDIHVSYLAPGFVQTPLTDRNDFPMPMRISTERASAAIRRGLAKGRAEIHFPKAFTLWLKTINQLPLALRLRLIRKITGAA